MDCFSPTFTSTFCQTHKKSKKHEHFNFLLVRFTLFPSSQGFLSGIKVGGNIVCTLLLMGKHDQWRIS